VSPSGHVIKGSLGAHVRERCLGALARHRIIVVDASKLVDALVGPVPIAVVPYFAPVYQPDGEPELDENGLALIRVDRGRPIDDPAAWEDDMSHRPGVVATGLFPAHFLDEIIVGFDDGHAETICGAKNGRH
jgi:ribose 5-phosphate isomerase